MKEVAMKDVRSIEKGADGFLKNISFRYHTSELQTVAFRSDEFAGPALFARLGPDSTIPIDESTQIRGSVDISNQGDRISICAVVENTTEREIDFQSISLKMGLDTYMDTYPDWRAVYFPTLLRCERTHFWGYAMTPNGAILGIASPDPVASWTLNYESIAVDNSEPGGRAGLHRIHSFSLDLLHTGPLPPRHPASTGVIKASKRYEWRIYLYAVDSLADLKKAASGICEAPMIAADSYSVTTGEQCAVRVTGDPERATLTNPGGQEARISFDANGRAILSMDQPGQYRLVVRSVNGKTSEAVFAVLHPWSWYLSRARAEAARSPQFASSHCEQWLGLHSAFLARRHIPDSRLDEDLARRFHAVYDAMWSRETGRPIKESFGRHVYRVFTNSAQMISLLCDVYEAGEGEAWLERAAKLADYVAEWQVDEGYYAVPDVMNPESTIVYTSVLYPAKSVLELCEIERSLAGTSPIWQERYERHYASAARAIAHLERERDNLNTEGQDTFEDGMIACSAAQLAYYALSLEESEERNRFADAAEQMIRSHRCLEQLIIPDARMNGSTLRFWEAQYDVLARKSWNMMNSPHGWTAWSLYAVYYLYLLTGKEEWLTHLFNGIGACVQLIHPTTGELRWSFIADPYVEASLLKRNPATPGRGSRFDTVLGEAYVPMIADFHYPESEPVLGNSPDNGWSCCNDVHEIFKCMEETVLRTAFVIETDAGEFTGRNCRVSLTGARLVVELSDPIIRRLQVNIRSTVDIETKTDRSGSVITRWTGRGWIALADDNTT